MLSKKDYCKIWQWKYGCQCYVETSVKEFTRYGHPVKRTYQKAVVCDEHKDKYRVFNKYNKLLREDIQRVQERLLAITMD
jgi:hypothetical protein